MAQTSIRKKSTRKPKSSMKNGVLSEATASVEVTTSEPIRLRPVSLDLWRGSLAQLRSDFLSVLKEFGTLRCSLFQKTSSKGVPQQQPLDKMKDYVALDSRPYHDFGWCHSPEGRPIHLKHPIVEVDGQPIIDQQGRPILCEMPATRIWTYHGSFDASTRLVELATRAGQTLLGSPPQAVAWIPQYTLFASRDQDRWLWSLFDLAWQGRHPSLRAERKTWFHPPKKELNIKFDVVYVSYDLQKLRAMRGSQTAFGSDIPEEWTERLPGYFVSELPNLFQASADLIDVLLDMAAQTGRRAPESAKPAGDVRLDEPAGKTPDDSMPRRARKAGSEYRQAAEVLRLADPTDREVYDYLAAAMTHSGEEPDLPKFDTWQRNLREYRRRSGQQKHHPRGQRHRGIGSIVPVDLV